MWNNSFIIVWKTIRSTSSLSIVNTYTCVLNIKINENWFHIGSKCWSWSVCVKYTLGFEWHKHQDLEIIFFIREPAGDWWDKSGCQIVHFGRQLILHNSQKNPNMILYFPLHARKVTNEEPQPLKTAWVRLIIKLL